MAGGDRQGDAGSQGPGAEGSLHFYASIILLHLFASFDGAEAYDEVKDFPPIVDGKRTMPRHP